MRGLPITARFALSLALGIACVAVDHNTRILGGVRAEMSARIVVPIVAIAQMPSQLVNATGDFLKSREQLIDEKDEMVERLLRLESELERNGQLSAENTRLRNLLGLRSGTHAGAEVAEVINTASLPFVDRVQLGKGRNDGLRNGEGVFDRDGVIGQVTRTDAHTSVVTLLTDPRIWISTRVRRNGLLAIVQGDPAGGRRLKVHYVPADGDLQVGDLLVTTGDGQVFPSGLPVAQVVSVRKQTGEAFLEAVARPTGSISQHRLLMVYNSTRLLAPNLASFGPAEPAKKPANNPIRSLFGEE